MSHDVNYYFFDLAALAPLWGRRWSELGRGLAPARRGRLREIVEFALDDEDLPHLDQILSGDTVRRTLSRSSIQFHALASLVGELPEFQGAICGTDSPYLSEPGVLIATALGGVLRGELPPADLRAVCKIHSVANPGLALGLPPKTRRPLGMPRLTDADLFRPWFRWQGPHACGNEGTGWGEFDLDNCLGPADTRRFIRFFRLAWDANWPVPFFAEQPLDRAIIFDTVSVAPRRKGDRHFREFSLVRNLVAPVERAGGFRRPALAFEKT